MAKIKGNKAPAIDIGISEKDRAAIAQGLSKLLQERPCVVGAACPQGDAM